MFELSKIFNIGYITLVVIESIQITFIQNSILNTFF